MACRMSREVEELLDRAKAEVQRVKRLDQTLGTAISFLEAAQERVHRDIAPVLRATVLEHLDQVTANRYVDCRVAPESLKVEVADGQGRWYSAGSAVSWNGRTALLVAASRVVAAPL